MWYSYDELKLVTYLQKISRKGYRSSTQRSFFECESTVHQAKWLTSIITRFWSFWGSKATKNIQSDGRTRGWNHSYEGTISSVSLKLGTITDHSTCDPKKPVPAVAETQDPLHKPRRGLFWRVQQWPTTQVKQVVIRWFWTSGWKNDGTSGVDMVVSLLTDCEFICCPSIDAYGLKGRKNCWKSANIHIFRFVCMWLHIVVLRVVSLCSHVAARNFGPEHRHCMFLQNCSYSATSLHSITT